MRGHSLILGKERTGTKAYGALKDPFMSHGGITYTKYFKDSELCNHDVLSVTEISFPHTELKSKLLYLISAKYRHMLVTGEKVCWNKIVNIQTSTPPPIVILMAQNPFLWVPIGILLYILSKWNL